MDCRAGSGRGRAFIQEPQATKGKISMNKIKKHYAIPSNDAKPRAAIGHSADLDIYSIPNLTDKDVCTCVWNKPNQDKPMVLISTYWDGLANLIPEKLIEAITFAKNIHYQYILCMDANAHSTTWGEAGS
jgi:hypothetical protein